MEIRDVAFYRLEGDARRSALRRSMGSRRQDEVGTRRRVGRAVIALGIRIAGDPAPRRRYA